jgi:hypothetical protein
LRGASGQKWRRTTPLVRTEPQKFRITHPFHPLSGRKYELLERKEHAAEKRACFLDKKGRQCEIPLSWTDLAPEDPFITLSSGKSWFRVADLLELVRLIEDLRP